MVGVSIPTPLNRRETGMMGWFAITRILAALARIC
jgi:hypothetical protein